MKNLLLATALTAAIGATQAHSAVLLLQAFDNGALEGSAVSTTGTASLRISTDPAFDIIDVSAAGNPFLPGADLTSATLNVTSGSISSLHTLQVNVIQTGISIAAGTMATTFTVNNLVGAPGPTTENTLANSSLLQSHVFPVGTVRDSVGPLFNSVGNVTSDEHQYFIGFSHPDQSVQDTIALTSARVIPEPSTWAMLALGFGGLAWASWRKRRAPVDFAA